MPDRAPRKLAVPIRRGVDGRVVTIEPDGPQDIEQCVLAIGRTRLEDRFDLPGMGFDPPVHHELPLDLDALRATLARHEPRAPVHVLQSDPRLAGAVDVIAAELELLIDDPRPAEDSDADE